MTTTKDYLGKQAGATVLDLYQDCGAVRIRTDPIAKYPAVRLSTDADTGAAAEAVRTTRINEDAQGLHVSVKGGTTGGMVVTGNGVVSSGYGSIVVGGRGIVVQGNSFSAVSTGGGRTIVNGVDITDQVNMHQGGQVLTEIVLCYGSSLVLNGSADIEVEGPVHSVDATIGSGSLHVPGSMDEADIEASSGSVRLGSVRSRMDIRVSSGSVRVKSYEGGSGRVSASSGSFQVACSSASSGKLRASVSSGSGLITGARHLDVKRSVSSGSLRVS